MSDSHRRALSDFLTRHREVVIDRWVEKVRAELASEAQLDREQVVDSLKEYLDGLGRQLRDETGGGPPEATARVHGAQRQQLGRRIDDMVREYGLLFEVVVALAAERGEELPRQCVHVLARCLFDGAADATAQYARRRDEERARDEARSFAFFAHELRNPLSSVMMAWRVLNLTAPLAGRAAATLARNLDRLVHLVDRSLVAAKLRATTDPPELQRERLPCAELLTEVEADARPHAEARGVELALEPWEGEIEVDRRLLFSALSNVVRNAVKFTRSPGRVALRSSRTGADIVFEVEDECGGLAEGAEHRLFEAFRQESSERSGFGLGLAIARHAVEAQGGQVQVENLPGKGCVFRIRVPAGG